MILVLCGTVFLSLSLLYMDVRESRKEAEVIRRNTYGQGSKTEEREVTVGGEKMEEPLEITVGERQYTSEEIKKVFEQNIRRLDLLILGENKSLDEVRSDLELITEIPDEPVEIVWELDRYDVMNMQGKLQEKKIAEEVSENPDIKRDGILVQLKAFLRYTEDETKEALYERAVKVFPPRLSEEEEKVEKILEEIQNEENNNSSKETIELPKKVEGEKITYRRR